jgi:YegS/Rv2252/BmrU family lipid kinase
MSRKILYFINPISGTSNKKKLVSIISEETNKRNIKFEIAYTQKAGNYEFLKNKINEEGITDIVICGGDGTISNITSYLIGEKVQVGIVPMGSGNGLAYAAGISRNIKKALRVIFLGKATWIDGFYINEQFGCMLSGAGFDAQVAHAFAKQKKRGLITYIIQAIKQYFTASDFAFIIEANGQQITTKALFVSIANSNQFGNYVKIAPKASLSDGLLDVIIVPKMNKIKTFFFYC